MIEGVIVADTVAAGVISTITSRPLDADPNCSGLFLFLLIYHISRSVEARAGCIRRASGGVEIIFTCLDLAEHSVVWQTVRWRLTVVTNQRPRALPLCKSAASLGRDGEHDQDHLGCPCKGNEGHQCRPAKDEGDRTGR